MPRRKRKSKVSKPEPEKTDGTWGTKKSAYFKEDEESLNGISDDGNMSETEKFELERKMEEEAVTKLQAREKEAFTADDFALDEYTDSDDDKEENVESKMEDVTNSEEQETEDYSEFKNELETSLDTLNNQIKPVIEYMKSMKSGTEKWNGLSFLEAKAHLLLSYCLNLEFYIMMKIHGQDTNNHPVFAVLTKQKTILEKIRPLDKRIRPQIDRILERSQVQSSVAPAKTPQLGDMVTSDNEASEQEEEDLEQENVKQRRSERNVYKPSKMSAVHYVEKDKRREKDEARITRRIQGNKMLKEISLGMSEKPMQLNEDLDELGTDDVELAKLKKRQAEVTAYEEENLKRLRETKEQRKKREAVEKRALEGSKFNDENIMAGFDELNFLISKKEKLRKDARESAGVQQESLENFVEEFKKEKKETEKKLKKRANEVIDPMQNRKKRSMSSDSEDDYEYYKQIEKEQKVKKTGMSETSAKIAKSFEREQKPTTLFTEDGERKAGYKIMKNKGLQPHRKKTDRNPRKRMRTKYEKRLKQRKGQVKDMRKKQEGERYEGEKSGLRTKVVTSRRVGNI